MKASALRIGNLVYIDNEKYHYKLKNIPLSVRSIDYNRDCNNKNTHSVGLSHINQKENTYYESPAQFIKFIEPIPLTEEWLIKFGFEKVGINYEIGDFTVWFNKPKVRYVVRLSNTKSIEVGTVHQLQNLYFALTNEELTHE